MVEGEIAIPDDLRERIKAARTAAKMSQRELGRRVGITQSAVAQIENGQALRSQYLLKICRVLRLAPPSVLEDQVLDQWMDLGRRALRVNPDFLAAMAAMVSRVVNGADSAASSDTAWAENSDDDDKKTSKSS